MKVKKRYLPITMASVIAVLALWLTGFSYYLNPQTWGTMSMVGYAFPVALLAVLATLVLCAFVRKRLLVFPVIGLLVAYQPVSLYFPLNTSTEVPDNALHILSYNTAHWGCSDDGTPSGEGEDGDPNKVAQYILDSNADVVCLQESGSSELGKDTMLLDTVYPYRRSEMIGGNAMMVFSKYRVTHSETIRYDSKANYSMALTLDVRDRKVIVISNHLETMGIPMKDREQFSTMVHGNMERNDMKETSHTILGYLVDASKRRAPQADILASYIRMHQGTPVIVCGDFNDIPHSYTHHTVQYATDAPLTDCFQHTGFGPGYTYGHFGMRVRIDNIMCSQDITSYNCTVDSSIDVSDHYPIHCWFTLEGK